MKKLMTSSMVIGLLFAAAACGSDKKSSSTTEADTATTTEVSSDVTTGDTTADSTTETVPTVGDVDLSGLSAIQAQAATIGLQGAAADGAALDGPCYVAIVAQLSDADAQLIVDAGVGGSPTLSAAGEALGNQIQSCIVTTTS